MPGPLNVYGDRLVSTTGRHGPDIASQRVDDLDRRALMHVLQHPGSVCVELGCGSGWHGLRLALLGASVHGYDLLAEPPVFEALRREAPLALRFVTKDVTQLREADLPARVDVGFAQRFIHFLPFEEALTLLRLVAAHMPRAAQFFISGSGLDSELGDGYAGKSDPLGARFAKLAPAMAEKHGIFARVCLYRAAELETLMQRAGFAPVEIWLSEFGNVKGVFEKRT